MQSSQKSGITSYFILQEQIYFKYFKSFLKDQVRQYLKKLR